MANVVNDTSSAFGVPLLHPGWDKAASWELRSQPLFRRYATKRVVDPTNNSRVYYMPRHKHLTVAADRHVVDEVVAADQVAAPESDYIRIQVQEHGHAVGRTTFLGDTTYIPVDPILAQQLAAHMADTLDDMTADVLYDGDQVRNDGSEAGDSTSTFTNIVGSDGGAAVFDFDPLNNGANRTQLTVAAGDTLSSRITARVVSRMRTASVVPFTGSYYLGIASPDTMVNYQEDTGQIGWHEPHVNVDPEGIYTGETGRYRGVLWIEHPRARDVAGAGGSGADVHQTLILGQEALAEHVTREPAPGVSPVLDTYNRHRTIYWYGTLGHAIFRQEAIYRVEHVNA